MKRESKITKWLSVLTVCLMVIAVCCGCGNSGNGQVSGGSSSTEGENGKNFDAAVVCLEIADSINAEQGEILPGAIGGEWIFVGMDKSGAGIEDSGKAAYMDALASLLKENDGVLDSRKRTEYSRTIIGLSAIGEDAADVAGYNLFEPLEDFQQVVYQGINGPIWAVIAADSQEYNLKTKGKYIDYILDNQLESGGWALMGDQADTDITAMAISALAPYYADENREPGGDKTRQDICDAIDKAVTCLSEMQSENGEFVSFGTETSESCSQVIIALSSLGINPQEDERFIKGGKSPVDVLMSYQNKDKYFSHEKGEESNAMATEQAFLAITSIKCMESGQGQLYL